MEPLKDMCAVVCQQSVLNNELTGQRAALMLFLNIPSNIFKAAALSLTWEELGVAGLGASVGRARPSTARGPL